jgi:hypothetical protein
VIGAGAWSLWSSRDRSPSFSQLIDRAGAEFTTGDQSECIVKGSVSRDEAYEISLQSPCTGLIFETPGGKRLGIWNGNKDRLIWNN